MMAESVKMERGYAYHANFIYNRPKLRYQSNGDCVTSLEIVNFAVDMMASWGYNKTYYHDRDALPGGNVFDEFFKTVKLSRFTVVIVTKGFVNDSWAKYKSQAAFSKLLEKERSNRFIALYINIDERDIPDMLILKEALQFNANWKTDLQQWNKLQELLSPVSRPVQDTGRDLYPQTYNPEQPNTVVTSRQNYSENQNLTTRQGGQENSYQRNPTTGRQDTNPPDPSILRGHDIATDSSDTPTQSPDQLSQQGDDNSQSLGLSVNGGQNTDAHNVNTDLKYQRESVSAGISGSSNSSPTTQQGNIDGTSGMVTSMPSNTEDVNTRITSVQEIRSPPDRSGDEVDNETNSPLEAPGRSPQETRSTQSSQEVAQTSRSPPDGEASQNNQNSVHAQREDNMDTNPKDLVGGDDENPLSSLDQHDVEVDTQKSTVQVQSQNVTLGNTRRRFSDDIPSDQQETQLVRSKDEFLNQRSSDDIPVMDLAPGMNSTPRQNPAPELGSVPRPDPAPGLDSAPRLDPASIQNAEITSSNNIQSSSQFSANNNSDGASFYSRMCSLFTDRDTRTNFFNGTFLYFEDDQ